MSSIDSNLIFEQYCTINETGTPPPPVAAAAGELADYPAGTQILYNNAVYTLPPSHNPANVDRGTPGDPAAPGSINVIDTHGAPFSLLYQPTNQGITDKTVTVTPPAPEAGAGAGAGAEEPKEVDPQANMSGLGKAANKGIESMQAGASQNDTVVKGLLGGVSKLVQNASQLAPEKKPGFRKY